MLGLPSPILKTKKLFRPPSPGMQRLVGVIQELSLARDLSSIAAIVRTAARELTGADGATLVLREGSNATTPTKTPSRPSGKAGAFPSTLASVGGS